MKGSLGRAEFCLVSTPTLDSANVPVSVSRLLPGDSLMPEPALSNETVATEPAASDVTGELTGAASVWASIQATLASIRLDSALSPGTYLTDTVVPHGGE